MVFEPTNAPTMMNVPTIIGQEYINELGFLEEYFTYPDINDSALFIGSIVSFIIGLFWVFVGKRFFDFIVLVLAFVFGYWFIVVICEASGAVQAWLMILLGIIAGILCAVTLHLLKNLAKFLFGAFLGVITGILIWILCETIAFNQGVTLHEYGVWICLSIFTLIGGILGYFLMDTIVRLLSPILGAFMISVSLQFWLRHGSDIVPNDKCDWICALGIAIFILFIILGWISQFILCKDADNNDDNKRKGSNYRRMSDKNAQGLALV